MSDLGSLASTKRLIGHISLIGFATALSSRSVDPLVPPIASSLGTDMARVALLTTAFALPFALVQPILGPLADAVGKLRMMMACLAVIIAASFVAAAATSFPVLLAARVIGGMASGGVFPVGMALVGDMVSISERQVALGRWLTMVMAGNLLGAAVAGIVADLFGWRAVFVTVGLLGAAAMINALVNLRAAADVPRRSVSLQTMIAGYAQVLQNPRAKFCFLAVFGEGIALFGLFPYIAVLLVSAGESRAAIAGIVIAAFSVGGLVYSMAVTNIVRRLKPGQMMLGGGLLAALAFVLIAFNPPWFVQLVACWMMGIGFFLLHGCVQVEASELLPSARGTALSMHSLFFFIGNAVGPVLYGLGFTYLGATPSVLLGGLLMILVGLMCAHFLRRP